MLRGKMNGSIQESVHAIEDIHKDKVIPFENTDDRYKKLIDTYYDEWKSFGDGFADFWDVVCDIGSGLFGAVKDLFVGVIDLLKGVVEIAGWLLLKVVQADKIGLMPEALEEDVTGIFTGIGSILKDPGNALEAMGQSTFDNADEKGIAYSVSYIAADTAIGIFLDKGLKKLGKADDLVKPAGYSDEAADAAKYGDEAADAAMEAAERGDELAKGAEEAAGYADEGGSGALSIPSSKVLRQNLIEAGVEAPDYPNAAHHIVAGNSPKAAEARAILQKYGVDINDAANGTFLPTVRDVVEGAYHPSLHTNSYYDKINKLLSEATCKEDVLDILEFVGDELSSGTFMQ